MMLGLDAKGSSKGSTPDLFVTFTNPSAPLILGTHEHITCTLTHMSQLVILGE